MSRIAAVFAQPGHKILIPYVTVGYPNIETTLKVVPLLGKSGCDIVELGIPFSDPLADGATIQKASFQALENGVTPSLCLQVARELSRRVEVPLVFMTYFNPILSYGIEKFCTDCANSNVDGLIVPDLPPEEGIELETATQKHDLDLIYLLAPTSTEDRVKLVAEKSQGFIYLVSITGLTGTRDRLPTDLETFVRRVRKIAKQPLCVGFGISTPEQANQVVRIADGVIIGSRLIQLMAEDHSLAKLEDFVKSSRKALDQKGEA
jgi:tryptophan synthase alpha chain